MFRIVAMAALLAVLGGCGGADGNAADAESNAANQVSSPLPSTVHFVNSPANALSEGLRRFYVDFAFDYPSSWAVTPPRTDGSERNFVRVAAPAIDGYEPFSFLVGSASGSGDPDRDRRDIERALPAIARGYGAGLENYRVASTGRARVGPYESWNWRFSGTSPGVEGGRPAQIVGRGDIVLPPGASRGVLIVSFVTDRAGETAGPDQVGESGALKAVYNSFRLGSAGR